MEVQQIDETLAYTPPVELVEEDLIIRGDNQMSKEIIVDGVVYTPKNNGVVNTEGKEYVMVRTYSAGVFAGYLKNRKGKEVELLDARRIWYWAGAASLSELATNGTSEPDKCKFPIAVKSIVLTEAIEIIPITEAAKKTIDGVKVWTK